MRVIPLNITFKFNVLPIQWDIYEILMPLPIAHSDTVPRFTDSSKHS
jgi:hypothetical protein